MRIGTRQAPKANGRNRLVEDRKARLERGKAPLNHTLPPNAVIVRQGLGTNETLIGNPDAKLAGNSTNEAVETRHDCAP